MIPKKKVMCLVLVLWSMLVSKAAETQPDPNLALLGQLDQLDQLDQQMASNVSPRSSENAVEHVCVYHDPYLKAERVMIRVNQTVEIVVIVLCEKALKGVPLWNGSENCKDNRNVTLKRTIWRKVYKREYIKVKKCCEGWRGSNCTEEPNRFQGCASKLFDSGIRSHRVACGEVTTLDLISVIESFLFIFFAKF